MGNENILLLQYFIKPLVAELGEAENELLDAFYSSLQSDGVLQAYAAKCAAEKQCQTFPEIIIRCEDSTK